MAPRPAAVLAISAALVLAGVAGVAVAAIGPPADETPTTAYPAVTADLGLATDAGDAAMRADFEQAALEHRLETASSASARESELEAHLADLDEELEVLADRERAAVDDDLDVRELVRGHAIATARLDTLPDLREELATTSVDEPSHRPLALEGRYRARAGPVRAAMLEAFRGGGRLDPRLDRAASGFALSAVADGRYLREAVRFDRWESSGAPDDAAAAIQAVAAAYPETTETTAAVRLGGGRYLVERTAPTGTVVAYAAGDEATIAAERQRHRVDRLSVDEEVETDEDGLRVHVQSYEAEGPLRVTVERADDGAPVDARVFLRFETTWEEVGSTGDDGRHWSTVPPGAFEVRVVAPDGSVATVAVD
ncbi:MAG: hypothetical protein ACLFM8_09000 [Halobacteriales archaeon]